MTKGEAVTEWQQDAPKKKMSTGKKVLIGVAALVLIGAIGSAVGGDKKDEAASEQTTEQTSTNVDTAEATTEATTPATTAPPATSEAPLAPKTTFEDGTWQVGIDIAPGTYKAEGGTCYWERLKGLSGQFDDIITNGTGSGQVLVTIEPTDKAFRSQMCGEWTLVG